MSRFVLFLLALGLAQPVSARPIAERVNSAKEIVVNRMTSATPIPDWVLDASKCVAALRVVKAGLFWGGQGSTGMVTCRTDDNRWSEPSFFTVSGVNFGLQIGVQFLESVLLFVTDFAREILNHASFQLGAELSVAAGPVGGGDGIGQMPNAHIVNYQRAVGLYAGATVNGFVLSHNPQFNRQAYGADVDPAALLKVAGEEGPEVVQPFIKTMNHYLPTN